MAVIVEHGFNVAFYGKIKKKIEEVKCPGDSLLECIWYEIVMFS